MTASIPTINGKQPIVNCDYNRSLTLNEMLQFPLDWQAKMTSAIIREATYGSRYNPKIDSSISKKAPATLLTKWENQAHALFIPDFLTLVYTDWQVYTEQLIQETATLHQQQGKAIYEAQKNLGFQGTLRMDLHKLVGYIQAVGYWNYFDPQQVGPALIQIDGAVPCLWDVNNSNVATPQHYWQSEGDGIVLVVDYCSAAHAAHYVAWGEQMVAEYKSLIQADSMRSGSTCVSEETAGYNFFLTMWWD